MNGNGRPGARSGPGRTSAGSITVRQQHCNVQSPPKVAESEFKLRERERRVQVLAGEHHKGPINKKQNEKDSRRNASRVPLASGEARIGYWHCQHWANSPINKCGGVL